MPYARINMVEFESREEMHKVITNLSVNMKTVFPEIRSFVSVETSEKSQITISVYDHKEAADRAGCARQVAQLGLQDVLRAKDVAAAVSERLDLVLVNCTGGVSVSCPSKCLGL